LLIKYFSTDSHRSSQVTGTQILEHLSSPFITFEAPTPSSLLITFLYMPSERLQKIIAAAGIASRRSAEKLITSGLSADEQAQRVRHHGQ
jgi:hypothetical protein